MRLGICMVFNEHTNILMVNIVVNNVVLVNLQEITSGILILQYKHIDKIGYIDLVILDPYNTIYIMMERRKIRKGEGGRGSG